MARSVGFVVVEKRKLDSYRKKLGKRVDKVLTGLAIDGRERCRVLAKSKVTRFPSDSGNVVKSDLNHDTGGLAASFYAVGPGLNGDYERSKKAMIAAYGKRYDPAFIEERIAPEKKVGHKQAAFGSASRVMAFWEYGHNNKWTGQWERRPFMRQVREELKTTAVRRFSELKKK